MRLDITATITLLPAVNTFAPAISGSTPVLSAVTGDTGTWTGTTGSARYRHKRDGVIIPGETASTYYRATADISHSLTREVGFLGQDGVLVWAASNALTDTVEATANVLKTPVESSPVSGDAAITTLLQGGSRWINSGSGARVIPYSYPTALECMGEKSAAYVNDTGDLFTFTYYDSPPFTYAVTKTSGTANVGDFYTNNGQTFKVYVVNGSTVQMVAYSKSPVPPASGTFTWTAGNGASTNVTYSSYVGFEAATAQEKTNIRKLLDYIEAAANIHFIEISETSSADTRGTLRFVNTGSFAGTVSVASGANPGTSFGSSYVTGGDVIMQKAQFNSALRPGALAQFGVLHEIGHTMGFSHAHAASPALDFDLDQIAYTVMTYRSYPGAGGSNPLIYQNATGTFPNTLMGIDVKALKFLYGANTRWKPAGVTYKFLPTGEWFIDGVSQGTPAGSKLLMTVIESSNGNDTYDFSAFNPGEVTANVGDGTWMDLPGLVPDMASGSTHRAPGSVFFEYGLNPANKTVILP